LSALGQYRFNWSPGETYRLASERWLPPRDLLSALAAPQARNRPGDVYAVLAGTPMGDFSAADTTVPGAAQPSHGAG
jgi:hypothetical protein